MQKQAPKPREQDSESLSDQRGNGNVLSLPATEDMMGSAPVMAFWRSDTGWVVVRTPPLGIRVPSGATNS